MDNITILKKQRSTSKGKARIRIDGAGISTHVRDTLVYEKIDPEVDENFKNYLSWNGLIHEEKLSGAFVDTSLLL